MRSRPRAARPPSSWATRRCSTPCPAAEAAWAGLGDVAFFRAFDLFCAGGVCGAQIPGTDVLGVVDYGHLTTAGSLYVAPFLTCFLESRNLSAAVAADRDSCPSSITDT